MPPVRRTVARVVLLDHANRVLLLPMPSDLDPAGRGYWYLPGGGIEGGEAPIDAVRREMLEELGVEVDVLEPALVHLVGVRFEFDGRSIEQDEWHFVGRIRAVDVGKGLAQDPELRAVAARRWWPLDELASTSETVFPSALHVMIADFLATGLPAATPTRRNVRRASRRRASSSSP